ncbi:MAG: ATP-binding protein [Chloroflexota bacterium]
MDTLSVPGTLDSLAQVRSFVKQAAEQAGLERKRAYRLQLAVDEIATNIINYGYARSGQSGEILLTAEINAGSLVLALQDSSPAFDPFTRARPDNLEQDLSERPTGGLGIFLAQENVDEYRYAYRDGCNHNIFVMYRTPPDDAPAGSSAGASPGPAA